MSDLQYTEEHEWVRQDGDEYVIGVTAYAADKLGDVVYLDLPKPGTRIQQGTVVGEIESTKSVGELFAPVDGEVTAVNEEAVASPELVNQDPLGAGWLIRVRTDSAPKLLSAAEYEALTAE